MRQLDRHEYARWSACPQGRAAEPQFACTGSAADAFQRVDLQALLVGHVAALEVPEFDSFRWIGEVEQRNAPEGLRLHVSC